MSDGSSMRARVESTTTDLGGQSPTPVDPVLRPARGRGYRLCARNSKGKRW